LFQFDQNKEGFPTRYQQVHVANRQLVIQCQHENFLINTYEINEETVRFAITH